MRKRMISLATMLLLILSLTAQAAEPRAIQAQPSLTFSGTTATCFVDIMDKSNSKLTASLTLWQGSRRLASWSASGTGEVTISETYTVERGKSYKLVFNSTVNGKGQPEVTVTGTC